MKLTFFFEKECKMNKGTRLSDIFWFRLLATLCLQLSWLPQRSSQEQLLTCVCTTAGCQALGESTCITASKCFSQLLDRQDGTRPIIRGCMRAGQLDSLLCMNRRPAVESIVKWPALECCSHHLCNQDISPMPSITPTTTDENKNELAFLGLNSMEEFHLKYNSGDTTDDRQKGLQHLYLIVIGISLVIMAIISSVGFYVLCSYRSKYKSAIQNKRLAKNINTAAATPLLTVNSKPLHNTQWQNNSTRPKYLNVMIPKESSIPD